MSGTVQHHSPEDLNIESMRCLKGVGAEEKNTTGE
jgi:hypothetical protein